MRIKELGLVVCVVAFCAAASIWRDPPTSPGLPTATATPAIESLDTESGASRIEAGPYFVAGIRPGMTRAEAGALLHTAIPPKVEQWSFGNPDEGALNVQFMDDRVLAVGGTGRWSLARQGQSLPGFMSSEQQVRDALGEPGRVDKQAWVYTNLPGELTFHFHDGRVTQVYLVGLLHPHPPRNSTQK
jgi:hypothetical protein